MDDAPITPAQPQLRRRHPPEALDLAPARHHLRAVLGVDQIEHVPPQQILRPRPAQHLGHAGIGKDDHPLAVHHHTVGQQLHQPPIAFLALTPRPFGLLEGGDVAPGPAIAAKAALLVEQRAAVAAHPKRPLGAEDLELEVAIGLMALDLGEMALERGGIIVGPEDVGPTLAVEPPAGNAEHPFDVFGEPDVAVLGVGLPEPVGGKSRHVGQPVVLLAELPQQREFGTEVAQQHDLAHLPADPAGCALHLHRHAHPLAALDDADLAQACLRLPPPAEALEPPAHETPPRPEQTARPPVDSNHPPVLTPQGRLGDELEQCPQLRTSTTAGRGAREQAAAGHPGCSVGTAPTLPRRS